MYDDKWTIRGIDNEARAIVEAIHHDTGIPYGRLVTAALWEWINGLDMGDPVPIQKPYSEAAESTGLFHHAENGRQLR